MKRWLAVLLIVLALPVSAAISTYEFKDEATRERFEQLTEELRCPKCQNQNLSDSNSPIAKDLRNEVYRMLDAGENDEAIVDFMVARYGEFVLYRPRVDAATYLLWYGPFGLLLLGVIVVFMITRRRKQSSESVADSSRLSVEEQNRLKSLLDQDSNK
jgi:cytochrome c-type biogenesis protein CcmH